MSRWTDEQHAAIHQLPEVAVSAAAGSGKTSVLVERVLNAALEGRLSLDRVLVVTFTRAAAAELRDRLTNELRERLETVSESRADAARLREQLARISRAQISTIHSFCLDIIERFGHAAGIAGGRLMSDDESALLRHELSGEFLRRELDNADAALRTAALAWGGADGVGMDDLSGSFSAGGMRGLLLRLCDVRQSLPDPAQWRARYVELTELDPHNFDAGHPLLAALDGALRQWVSDAIARDERMDTLLQQRRPDALLRELIRRRRPLLRALSLSAGWDALLNFDESFKVKQDDISHKPTLLQAYTRDLDKDAEAELYRLIKSEMEPLQEEIKDWCARFSEPWEVVARRENTVRAQLGAVWELAERFTEHYNAHKLQRGLLDYADLEQGALRLLASVDETGAPRWTAADPPQLAPSPLAEELRRHYQLVLVDEYQDTSPIQDALLALVTPEHDAAQQRFIVGDLKQSIYAFRLAEPALFSGRWAALQQSGGGLRLTSNFRSRPAIVNAVNHVFDGLMDTRLGGEDYGPARLIAGFDYAAAFAGSNCADDVPARLNLVEVSAADSSTDAISEDADADGGSADDAPGVQELCYRKVASLLAEIHAEGREVYDKQLGRPRRVEWRDMAVLLRSVRGRMETLRSELDRAVIPYYAPGRSGFYERPEVADALALLAVVDNLRQDVALAAVLHGPAVGLSFSELLRVGLSARADDDAALEHYGAGDLWQRLQAYIADGDDPELREALARFAEKLARWRTLARREPLSVLLQRIYRDTGLLAAAAALPGGTQRVANLQALYERARSFSSFERQGLARFLDYIERSRRAAGDAGEAPLLDEAQNVVRVMTVHQAKGLEFPVVIVPDMQSRFNETDLRRDVLWGYALGIGGRYLTLSPPERAETLSWRMLRDGLREAMVSEELRVLYVALTRARERLELVAAIKPGELDELPERHPGLSARRRLDWLAPQLGSAVRAALAGEDGASTGTDGCWEVRYQRGAAQASVPAELPPLTTRAEHEALLQRLAWEYPRAATSRMPAKATVTRIAQAQLADADAESLPIGEAAELESLAVGEAEGAEAAPPLIAPRFLLPELPPGGNEIGTAAHLLLAELDPSAAEFSDYADPQRIAALLERLVVAGRIEPRIAARLSPRSLAEAVGAIAAWLPTQLGPIRNVWRELPLSLLVPAHEVLALVPEGRTSAEQLDPEAMVQIDGTIDLLLDDGVTALLLDYKTGYRNLSKDELAAHHRPQLEWYCRAAASLLPGRNVRWALHGLDGHGLVGPFDYAAATIPPA